MWAREIVAITDSSICKNNLLGRIKLLAKNGVSAIILREKELESSAYSALAQKALQLCANYGTACILHSFTDIAKELGANALHCQSTQITQLPRLRSHFSTLGVSVHSVEEYLAAREWVDYVIAGHIFQSSCKIGVKPIGVGLLESIIELESTFNQKTDSSHKPLLQGLYAIGGITLETLPTLVNMPISGVCMRTPLMIDNDTQAYLQQCRLL